MDAALWELLAEGNSEDEVAAIIRLGQPGIAPPGVRLVSQFGHIATCRLQRGAILATREDGAVASFKASRVLAPEQEIEDSALEDLPESFAYLDERRPPDETATGRGVVIGVIDWGCDFAHPDFRNPDGSTRLLALWDQRSQEGANSPGPYGYGVVHTREAINKALANADPYAALNYHPADSDTGRGSHGTHVLSIAAGNGRGGGPEGVAPEALLVFVHSSPISHERSDRLGDSVTLLEAVDFIAHVAGDCPWVINLSMGRHGEPHDGSTLVEQGLDEALRSTPGCAVVQSTGNYFERGIHSSGQLRPAEERSLTWEIEEVDPTPNQLEVWYSGLDAIELGLTAPGHSSGQVAFPGEQVVVSVAGREIGKIYHRRAEPNNLCNHIEIILYPGAPPGSWEVRLKGKDIVDGRYHAWIERDAACPRCQSRFSVGDSVATNTTGTICNGFRTIAVGAYDPHSPRHELAPFSSSGPTRDGRLKPDLLAPGVRILAARSSPRKATDSKPMLTRMSGTSMASPYVAGTVALMFEVAPRRLRIEETHNLLLANSRKANLFGENIARIGSGYCEISEAVAAARSISSVPGPAAGPKNSETEAIMKSESRHESTETTEDPENPSPNGPTTCCRCSSHQHGALQVEAEPGDEQNEGFGVEYQEVSYHNSAHAGDWPWEANHTPRDQFGKQDMALQFGPRLIEHADEVICSAPTPPLSHRAMLGETVERATGTNPLKVNGQFTSSLSPASLFEAFAYNKNPAARQHFEQFLEVVAAPRSPLPEIRPGDFLLRHPLGEGEFTHVSMLATGNTFRADELASAGINAEGSRPGYYSEVIEAGWFPHRQGDRFARRLSDENGLLTHDGLILRIRPGARNSQSSGFAETAGGSVVSFPPASYQPMPLRSNFHDALVVGTLQEQVSIDDVTIEMNGLRCRFLSNYRATRADGSVRSFAVDALLPIDDWNGTSTEATVAGFNVPKLVLAPAPDIVSGMRRYDVALEAQRTAIVRNIRELADWVAHENAYRRNHATWERERARLETLLMRRQAEYDRMWVRQMMYNRFDLDIARWVTHYNTQLTPATALDPNVVKSMLYQESRMGTSGAHLMPPPSDWSSATHHPVRSRFNIGQAIDSWGPQQWLMIREMAAAIFTRYGLSAFDRTWFGMSNADYAAHAPFIRALREFFEFRDASNRNLMGTPARDLHEDYGFWIRTAIRWLFVKYAHLSNPTWAEAVRAYNGGGARARAYRDAVMARVGSPNPYAAESVNSRPNGYADENAFALAPSRWQEDAPDRDRSAEFTWEDLTRVPDSNGQPQLFYVVTGAPASVAQAGDEGKAIFNLRVRNTNTVYNHKDVITRQRLLDVLPNRQFREVMPWNRSSAPDLEDESSRVIKLSLHNQTLLAAYNPDSPMTRLEVEYHWRETFENSQEHYNQTGLDFFLVAPIEYLLSRKQRLSTRDIELNDPARYKADYWIPITGVDFTPDIRHPVTIQLDVTASVGSTATGQQTIGSGQTRSTTRSSTTSNTFNLQLSGEVSQGGSANAKIEVLELGVQEMFKLGASLGYSHTRTDTSATTVAREFTRSLMLSRTYATSQAVTTRTTLTVSPPEVPQPRGTGSRSGQGAPSVGIGSVGVYLYPLVAFFEVPYVRFEGVNAMGQATRRSEGKVAVPFVTEWRLTSHRGG
jgi:subtilisin family serine protease